MELNLIIESKNFDHDVALSEELNRNPCKLCLLGKDMMCVERKYCRWKSHREIYIKKEVVENNDLLNN